MSWSKLAAVLLLLCVPARAADIAISALPAASSVSGSDILPIVQSGTTKKATFTIQQNLWDARYQPLDGDLTSLSAASGTHTIYYRSAASTWSPVTIGTGLNFTGATLAVNTPTPTPTATATATPTPSATATPTATAAAPADAHYVTSQAESGLSNEVNLGALSTGLLLGTVSGSVSTISSVTAPSGTVVGTTDTQTLTNKWVKPRSGTTSAPGATPTLNTDNYDVYTFTSLGTAITSMTTNLSGTPVTGQKLLLGFKDDGTPRAITWGTSFQSGPATLLATTATSKQHWVGLVYDGSKWTCFAVDATGY